ncbi:biotin--[acetyl-CoA-carboxylase] ligase [Nocardiopsis sp. CNT312]|uniref:biotin--[acetyl-CoA-carboxylase] ligase n=1 Tax=Nocardiopsis sp. CNT312 TaxID=1137268 RepID=UPI00048E7467|nr:biotin--[acetyl-CoA-carboxylase] ligase [Nocardiopsis sp. CNT312]
MTPDTEDLPRPPLDTAALTAAVVRPGGTWRSVEVLPAVGSTNTELAVRARGGAPHGTVLATEHQTAGKGRLGRGFTTPDRAALTFSVLLRPRAHPDALGWLTLLMGVAAVRAICTETGVAAALKWPNDVIVPAGSRPGTEAADGKLAGILSEADFSDTHAPAVVVGMGLNVSQTRAELPVDTAASLRGEGAAAPDRTALLTAVLAGFGELYTAWSEAGGDAGACGLADAYRDLCTTVGRRVRVHLPGGSVLEGTAAAVDTQARLVVRGPVGERVLTVGDVVHVRPGE